MCRMLGVEGRKEERRGSKDGEDGSEGKEDNGFLFFSLPGESGPT